MFSVLLSTWAVSSIAHSYAIMSVIQWGYYYTCWRISQQNRFLLETIDQTKPRNFRKIVVKDRSLSRICPATFPFGHLMVSKVPVSQLLEHFVITSTTSSTRSQAFRLLGSILDRKGLNYQISINFSSSICFPCIVLWKAIPDDHLHLFHIAFHFFRSAF